MQLSVGYQFTPWVRGLIGYNFLYLSSVVRPGTQIDNTYDGVVHPLVPDDELLRPGQRAQCEPAIQLLTRMGGKFPDLPPQIPERRYA